jgi:hypothetical protein
VAAGTVLLALGLFANRLESFEGAGVKLQLQTVQTAAAKLEEARQADEAGDPARAEDLRKEARRLLAAVQPMAATYEQLRLVEPAGSERTERMTSLVRQARAMAKLGFVDAQAVEELFRSGSDGNRIMAIGLMRGAPELASLSLVVEVIRHPRSGFEQWQALRLAQELLAGAATPADRTAIREAIEFAESSGSLVHGSDTSRLILANKIRASGAMTE